MTIKANQLYFGKFSAQVLAKKFKTPLYVYEAETIRRQYLKLAQNIAYEKLNIHYACKANTNVSILKIIRKLGGKIEAVSQGEVELAFKAGFKPKEIIYTSTSISREEFSFVIKNNISANLDSLSQIELYGKMNPGASVGIRVNQGIGAGHHSHVITGGEMSKFGIPIEQLGQVQKLAKKYKLKITRLHQHIGSNVLDEKILLQAFDKLLETARNFPGLEALDFGGGFGVAYLPKEKEPNLKIFGATATKKMKMFCRAYGRELTMVLEPGRFLVAESGTLLATVTEIKNNPTRTFIGVDTGFNHLIRPILYGSYHEIVNTKKRNGKNITADIVGNICESGDVFGRDRQITLTKIGDILAIKNTGAYGYAMASHFNSRLLPAEILIDAGKVFKI
ncbi:MAG: diaminopimelate decarboxylase [bacterium]|nr:diaminopimelate decarboxylase [bacterium]